MKPVLMQYLHRKNKGKSNASPISEEEKKHYDDKFGSFVLWFVVGLVLVGLFLK